MVSFSIFKLCSAFAVLLTAQTSAPWRELPNQLRQSLRYPLLCAGIRVGHSTDSQVVQRFGKGLFLEDEGHGGGRYYTDTARKVTLHVEIGPGSVIESLQYQRGIYLRGAPGPDALRRAVSQALSAHEQVQPNIALGTSPRRLIRLFGRPLRTRRHGDQLAVVYETDYNMTRDIIDYKAEFRFVRGRLTYVDIENGE